ncbi:hypothetical protein PBCVNEJV1_074L [Paramecium bursaria Chlorella virus NE-JV-1]|nr:hypothetical protein PBCVNEJV1_074L [Paramecium bursaria Chlorella virus NE-JV-1]
MHVAWSGSRIVVRASERLKISRKILVNTHKQPSYGKLLGIAYSYFEICGNHIKCSFPQKMGPFSYELTFEKNIQEFPGVSIINFHTVDSIAHIDGTWTVEDADDGSLLSLYQEISVPKFLKIFPIKTMVSTKMTKMFNDINKLSR